MYISKTRFFGYVFFTDSIDLPLTILTYPNWPKSYRIRWNNAT